MMEVVVAAGWGVVLETVGLGAVVVETEAAAGGSAAAGLAVAMVAQGWAAQEVEGME